METTQTYTVEEAARIILTAMQRLRREQISGDAFRETMVMVQGRTDEATYTAAKFRAAANDR